jgi:hypothetical protein
MSTAIVACRLVLVLGKVSVDVASETLASLVGKYVYFGIMNMKNSIKSYMSVVLAPWEIGPECLCAVGGIWQHWCLWKDLGASKRLREIACVQCTTDGLWRRHAQLASRPPSLHIRPADRLSCATWWCTVMTCWWRGLDCAPQQRCHVFATVLALCQWDFWACWVRKL